MAGMRSPLAEALRERYTLERELGRGGMATVYLAHDLRHDRPVALKVLHPGLAQALGTERFLREIKLAARLQHPHILSVFDSGETAGQFWFTMPYVEGETLRARLTRERQLPIEDALRIAREAAEALEYAHRHGVIHRDIKPENILLTDEHALVADFGIARAMGSGADEGLTETGFSVGTPAYMSPEQAAGERSLDARTDIYSLGVVLYEMLAGEPPYTGPTAQAIMARRFSEPVPSVHRFRPAVPDSVDRSLRRALAPVPADRFTRAAEFGRALSVPTGVASVPVQPADATRVVARPDEHRPRVSRALVLGIGFLLGLGVLFGWLRSRESRQPARDTVAKRLAVLPFESEGDTNERIFAAGMSEEITTRLARVPGLSLMARSSALQYRRSGQTAPQFGHTLGVEYVLDGTIRSVPVPGGAKRLRITPELIRVSDGTQIWGEPYDGTTNDVFRLQSDVAEQVARALGGRLGSAEQGIQAAPTKDLEAYRLYTLGRAEWSRRDPETLDQAARYFEQAIARDSNFARAWAGLADAYALFPYYGVSWFPNDTAYARAKSAALRAIALDSTLAEPHASLNQILRYGYWDWEGSEREIKRAIQLDPSYATAHQWYGEHLLDFGRFPEALSEAKISVQLDPLSRGTQNCLGIVLWFSGRTDEAIRVLRQAIARDSALGPSWWLLNEIYINTGHTKEALEMDRRFLRLVSAPAADFFRAWANPQARALALQKVRTLPDTVYTPYGKARVYALLGDPESAFRELNRAIAHHDGGLEWVKVDPDLASLRGDPRYSEIVRQIGLTP